LRATSPDIELDKNGYTANALHNLIKDVALDDFEADLRQGDGNELAGKFRAAHSSSALAVNNFAVFKSHLPDLILPGGRNFHHLQFERKCPHGLASRRSPNLDILAEGSESIVAIESKCLEYLSPHTANFAPAYNQKILDARRQTVWFTEMQRLVAEPKSYRWLDAAQLVKHAFGLAYSFPDRPVTLLYLFWEPDNAAEYPVFAEHRHEISRFSAAIGESTPAFRAMSYPELWSFWNDASPPVWLKEYIGRVRTRYSIAI
jgi:hypothetical protein